MNFNPVTKTNSNKFFVLLFAKSFQKLKPLFPILLFVFFLSQDPFAKSYPDFSNLTNYIEAQIPEIQKQSPDSLFLSLKMQFVTLGFKTYSQMQTDSIRLGGHKYPSSSPNNSVYLVDSSSSCWVNVLIYQNAENANSSWRQFNEAHSGFSTDNIRSLYTQNADNLNAVCFSFKNERLIFNIGIPIDSSSPPVYFSDLSNNTKLEIRNKMLFLTKTISKIKFSYKNLPIINENYKNDFVWLKNFIETNYPLYFYNKKYNKLAGYQNYADSLLAQYNNSTTQDQALQLMKQYFSYFNDGHLSVWKNNKILDTTLIREIELTKSEEIGPVEFNIVKENLAYLRLSSMSGNVKPILENVIMENAKKLSTLDYLILDLRNNGGGNDNTFDCLKPYLMSGPAKTNGCWFTVGSEQNMRAAKERITSIESMEKNWLIHMSKHKGKLTILGNKKYSITAKTYLPNPSKIAILQNHATGSAAESLLRLCMASKKVTTFGEESAGAGASGNVPHSPTVLPSGLFFVNYPLTCSVDFGGEAKFQTNYKPNVVIPESVTDTIQFVYEYLKKLNENKK